MKKKVNFNQNNSFKLRDHLNSQDRIFKILHFLRFIIHIYEFRLVSLCMTNLMCDPEKFTINVTLLGSIFILVIQMLNFQIENCELEISTGRNSSFTVFDTFSCIRHTMEMQFYFVLCFITNTHILENPHRLQINIQCIHFIYLWSKVLCKTWECLSNIDIKQKSLWFHNPLRSVTCRLA